MSSRATSTRRPGQSGLDPSPRSRIARIGVGVDGRPRGRDAVVLASLLAHVTHADLMLIAVFEEPLLATVVPAGMGWTGVQSQTRAMLASTRESFAPGARTAVQTDALVWRGLRHVGRREHHDLLVVGSGQGARPRHTAFGERSQELLGHLDCPLAIAPKAMANGDRFRLERIGVAYDGGAESRAALELAGWIAVTAGAELEVRGIIDYRGPGGLTTDHVLPDSDAAVADKTRSLLREALTSAGATGASVQVDVIPGKPAEALLALSAGIDLLVTGSGRRGPSGRVSLGSTGKALVGGARCPVLVVPRPRDPSAL